MKPSKEGGTNFEGMRENFFGVFRRLESLLPEQSEERRRLEEFRRLIEEGRIIVVPVDERSLVRIQITAPLEAKLVEHPRSAEGVAVKPLLPALLLDYSWFFEECELERQMAELALATSVALSLPGIGKGYERPLSEVYSDALDFRKRCMIEAGILQKSGLSPVESQRIKYLELKAILGDLYVAGVGIQHWNRAVEEFLKSEYREIASGLHNNIAMFCFVRERDAVECYRGAIRASRGKFSRKPLNEQWEYIGGALVAATITGILSSPRRN